MSSINSRMVQIHERNKSYLEKIIFDDKGYSNDRRVNIIHVDRNLILVDYTSNRTNYRYLRVIDSSTRKFYFLSVPNNISNCKLALAWTFGMDLAEYDLGFET